MLEQQAKEKDLVNYRDWIDTIQLNRSNKIQKSSRVDIEPTVLNQKREHENLDRCRVTSAIQKEWKERKASSIYQKHQVDHIYLGDSLSIAYSSLL